nr:protein FAR1-RELATED SEQUENCE 4-like [Quercus suber]
MFSENDEAGVGAVIRDSMWQIIAALAEKIQKLFSQWRSQEFDLGGHMKEEITSASRLVELNEHNSDNEMKDTVDLKNNELNKDNVENEKEETRKVEDKVEDACVGMLFGSIDDIMEYFTRYGNKKGFAVVKRTSRKGNDGEVESLTVTCNRAEMQQIKASNSLKAQPQSKTGCKAHFNMIRCLDGWILKSMELDHNHGLSPSKTRFYKCNSVLKPHVKRQLELNAKADIKMNKSFNSLVVEAGGHENLPFLEKDCRNHMDKVKRLELREGDAVAMNKYFLKMQANNSNFFYMMDFTEDGQLKNVFWADARSREAFKEFGDVVTFDTMYLVNKYSMPFAPFVGVNHHGQSILLGCGLISGEDADTFRWLFESWLTCMSGVPPSAIITDQDKAIKKAIQIVFPKARHRWYYWVPAFVKDTFWAGMSTTQQSESINAFFDGYVHHETTLKEFVKQYDKALAKNVVNENTEDFNSFQSSIPCFTHYAMEKQFQSVYTIAKYKEFRKELQGKVCCNFSLCKEDGVISEYEIREDGAFGENSEHATFLVYFNKDTNEVNCNCRFFEFRGILCRHQITVLFHMKIDQVPNKYILKRWCNNIKRSHTKVRINYDNRLVKPKTQRFDKMYKVFNEVADLAVDSDDKCEKVVARILELKGEFKQEKLVCGSNEPIFAGINC